MTPFQSPPTTGTALERGENPSRRPRHPVDAPPTNDLVSLGVKVTFESGLTEREVLNAGDSVDSVFVGIPVGGYFVLNPNIHFVLNPNIHFLRMEGTEGDIASSLDSIGGLKDVKSVEVLDETYPEKMSWSSFVVHTFDDPR